MSLDAINKFGVTQARPLSLSIIRQYLEFDVASLRQTKNAISAIENFTFQFNAITQSRGGGGISAMYSNLARKCYEIESKVDFGEFLKILKKKFRERDISKEEFVVNFKQLHYSNEKPKDRTLVRYVLRKLHRHASPLSSQDYNTYSIEHLSPQSGELPEEVYGNIGNTTFLPSELNEKLGSKSFKNKKTTILSKNHGDGIFDSWIDANPETIDSRAESMAILAFDKIWKI